MGIIPPDDQTRQLQSFIITPDPANDAGDDSAFVCGDVDPWLLVRSGWADFDGEPVVTTDALDQFEADALFAGQRRAAI